MEQGWVFNLIFLKLRTNAIWPLTEFYIIHTREWENTAWIDTYTLDCEFLSWEVATLHKECLIDIVRDSWVEFDLDLESVIG